VSQSAADPATLLRSFLDDCLSVNVGAQRALERIESDATDLERIARLSMECEERVQTGCLMVQALTLVRYWTLQAKDTNVAANEKKIIEWRSYCGPPLRLRTRHCAPCAHTPVFVYLPS
jgi:hypothetical protein